MIESIGSTKNLQKPTTSVNMYAVGVLTKSKDDVILTSLCYVSSFLLPLPAWVFLISVFNKLF